MNVKEQVRRCMLASLFTGYAVLVTTTSAVVIIMAVLAMGVSVGVYLNYLEPVED